MLQTGITSQICGEMKNYSLNILGVSECRWTGQGKKILSNNEMHNIYYARKNNKHTRCVAILITNSGTIVDLLATSKPTNHNSTFLHNSFQANHHSMLHTSRR
jgi:hypothetical protein